MTKERLQSFPITVLRKIAEKEGFKGDSTFNDRELLIDYIFEAMDDSRSEREILNNPAMQLKGRKYDIFQDEELVSRENEIFPIPERYNETRIVLLLRDPQWAFTYWDVNDLEAESLKKEVFFEGFFLRVYEFHTEEFKADEIDGYFDIPVSEIDDSWYINLLHGGKWYSVSLFAMVHNKEIFLCSSNAVKSPKGYIAENKEEFLNDPVGMNILLSSLWDYKETGENAIPQRIISIMDIQHLQLKT